jgi:hypothetical protein
MEMVCQYCGEITRCSCPEETHTSDAKFVCELCMALMEDGVPEAELKNSPKREEMRKMAADEEEISRHVDKKLKETFDNLWSDEKESSKEMSKKELAEYFYGVGMTVAFAMAYADADSNNDDKLKKRLHELSEDGN